VSGWSVETKYNVLGGSQLLMIYYTSKHKIPFLIDDEFKEILDHYFVHFEFNHEYIALYVGHGISHERIRLHQFLFGKAPVGMQWDHINRIKIDNRRENLRLVSANKNNTNKDPTTRNRSGFIGVCPHRDKWRATLGVNGRTLYGPARPTPEEAYADRKELENRFYPD
jgi:hypothetical protein